MIKSRVSCDVSAEQVWSKSLLIGSMSWWVEPLHCTSWSPVLIVDLLEKREKSSPLKEYIFQKQHIPTILPHHQPLRLPHVTCSGT